MTPNSAIHTGADRNFATLDGRARLSLAGPPLAGPPLAGPPLAGPPLQAGKPVFDVQGNGEAPEVTQVSGAPPVMASAITATATISPSR
ncbi:hypothetical protein [Novosphingobium humi]|uniref:hypothetical protein n=1 Tax=Novosphingobium humi TaxID=2282397 RepID=UPI0025AF106D|nr:hypothetical protein [Novosphingobium humi]WJS98131.1 hypothetical protein NYQ05_13485 [Novosphingobium humi]